MTQVESQTLNEPPAGDVARLTDHLFRYESGKLVSVLTRVFGTRNLQLAEDVVQEALVRALQTWPYRGIPENPAAWLTQTARNLALDVVRREKRFRDKEADISQTLQEWSRSLDNQPNVTFEGEIADDRLRLLFTCCHPELSQESQTALALRTLCGFSPTEIARAFLTNEATIAKRLTRARQRIRDLGLPFEIPSGAELAPRLDAVLQTIYLLFNEGYKASSGDKLIRIELCHEAIRLATLLVEHPSANNPRTHALLALMLLNASRLPARVNETGGAVRLQDQDRSLWNKELVNRGMLHLVQSGMGGDLTNYHIQAAISACHCLAPTYQETDWARILGLYDKLMEVDSSPVVALNRTVALSHVHGPETAIAALESISSGEQLNGYHLFYAVRAEFNSELGNLDAAAHDLEQALQLTEQPAEQDLLKERLRKTRHTEFSSSK